MQHSIFFLADCEAKVKAQHVKVAMKRQQESAIESADEAKSHFPLWPRRTLAVVITVDMHSALIMEHNALLFLGAAASFVLIRAQQKQNHSAQKRMCIRRGAAISAMLITIIAPSSDISRRGSAGLRPKMCCEYRKPT